MTNVGIICEYNPFHNGHIHHINEIKKIYPDSNIILVMSGNFTQRGDFSLIDKWKKTEIALNYVDLVVELPFIFAVQSADIFARAAIQILDNLNVTSIVFGTETLDVNDLNYIANIQRKDEYNELVKSYLDKGINYPTAMSKAVYFLTKIDIKKPNDLLGLSYIKEIQKTNIMPITIPRTTDYNSEIIEGTITSATSIRKLIKDNQSVESYVPRECFEHIKGHIHFKGQYFELLKSKIISEINHLDIYLNVDEGIENRIKKFIYGSNTIEELIDNIKTKRYTYNKINRMLLYILCGLTKDDVKNYNKLEYIRVLGFNKNGRKVLRDVKKTSHLPIITQYTNKYKMLEIEMKVSYIYYCKEKDKVNLTLMEYKHKPIIK